MAMYSGKAHRQLALLEIPAHHGEHFEKQEQQQQIGEIDALRIHHRDDLLVAGDDGRHGDDQQPERTRRG